jgi:hypothetical protein
MLKMEKEDLAISSCVTWVVREVIGVLATNYIPRLICGCNLPTAGRARSGSGWHMPVNFPSWGRDLVSTVVAGF